MNKSKVEEHFTRFDGIQKDLKTEQFEKTNELRELIHQMDNRMKTFDEKLEDAINGSHSGSDESRSESESRTNS